MAKISIMNLGPVRECNMEIVPFTVITGAQAAGKSTIAKCVYFFRTIKDDIYDMILKRTLLGNNNTLYNDILKVLRSKFLQMFGTSKGIDGKTKLAYYYDDVTYIQVSLYLQDRNHYLSPDSVRIDFSEDITEFLRAAGQIQDVEKNLLKQHICQLFHDEYDSVFIPAGRSLITLLTSQLNYLFATMDDDQKRSIDFCTQKYIERILKIRPAFERGVEGLINQKYNTPGLVIENNTIDKMLDLISKILKGKYFFIDNEERLYLTEKEFVKINYTSSGQQETVWVFNMLLHILLNNVKAFIILEEPEAHLYPQAQSYMVELLALAANRYCGIMLTTHSPYILGALNNLLYAAKLSKNPIISEQVNGVVETELQIDKIAACFVENGLIHSCLETEEEGGLIVNEVIDGASSEINGVYDQLFNLIK